MTFRLGDLKAAVQHTIMECLQLHMHRSICSDIDIRGGPAPNKQTRSLVMPLTARPLQAILVLRHGPRT